MNFNETSIKRISCLIIVSILSINLSFFSFTPKANALDAEVVLVSDPSTLAFFTKATTYFVTNSIKTAGILTNQTTHNVWTVAQSAAIKAGEAILRNLARRLIQQITEKTVDWIQSGFKGNPAYVSDPRKFLTNTADAAVGDFIFNDPDLNFLCSPFQIQVRLALGLSFQTFKSRINCTLSGVANNVQNAVRGANLNVNVWDNWIQTTTNEQNTPIGAFLIAQGELGARIGNKQIDLQSQLNQGFGALAYEECTGTRTPKGISGPGLGQTYTYRGSKAYEDQNRDYNNYIYSDVKCEVKTPGAVITNMLGFKATSDQRMNELVGALGDGIDTIFAALADSLIKKGLAQLTNGVLGTNNSSENAQYNLNLSSLSSQTQTNYNNDVNNINANGVTSPTDIFAQYNNVFSASSNSTLSNSAISGTVPSSNSTANFSQGFNQFSYTPTNEIGVSDPLAIQKTNALSGISYYLNAEAAYQGILVQASTTLTAAKAVFTTARNCNVNLNTANSVLRANLINSNVIQNIDGTPNVDSYRTLAQIPWNLTSINNEVNVSNNHVVILNTAQNAVNAASTATEITDAMTPVNSTSFNTDPQKNIIENIKTWLRGVRDIYSTSQCPINIDKILSTSTSTPVISGYVFNTDLSLGSSGADVSALQQILINGGYLTLPSGVSTGYFGNLTKTAVIKYQFANNLPGTGVVDSATRAVLNAIK